MRRSLRPVTGLFALLCVFAQAAWSAEPEWVTRSNENSQILLNVIARFNPEQAAQIGVDGYDEAILDLKPGIVERSAAAVKEAQAQLEARLKQEKDERVRQDLEILIKAAVDDTRSSKLEQEYLLPYFNLNETLFRGIRALIDPQVPKERYPAAITRIKRYAGLEKGYTPITKLAEDRTRERFDVKGLAGPYKGQVEQDQQRAETFIKGIEDLLKGSGLEGWQEPYAALAKQMRDYNEWVKKEVLSRARDDFRLPRPIYSDNLHNWGVDADPDVLIAQATTAYMDIRNEMVALAPLVAKQKGYDTNDYHEVIRRLKKDQIPGDQMEAFYRKRLGEIEKIIVEHKLVTLPKRPAGIRVGTEAETAAQPAPHVDVPRMIGNTGEYPQFVIPLVTKNEDGSWKTSDDYVVAGSWTLTAHEARPGHELQFSSMLDGGVSVARALFAFNSANVEGWGLYAEAITKPYMPLDGQLMSLQYRLMRAARMFLDPMLNLGRISPEDAKRLLLDDVVLDDGWAQNEIERYTYRIPGQATAYYFGYAKLQQLRAETMLALRDKFDLQAFHDFILAQGLLPPDILHKAVMEKFVPRYL